MSTPLGSPNKPASVYDLVQQILNGLGYTPTSHGPPIASGSRFLVSKDGTKYLSLDGANLATADPHVVGAVWSNAGVVTISAG
jgi:hypothetical protein